MIHNIRTNITAFIWTSFDPQHSPKHWFTQPKPPHGKPDTPDTVHLPIGQLSEQINLIQDRAMDHKISCVGGCSIIYRTGVF